MSADDSWHIHSAYGLLYDSPYHVHSGRTENHLANVIYLNGFRIFHRLRIVFAIHKN